MVSPAPHVVVKFPSPYNQDIVYRDKSNTCYKYQADKGSCPMDKSAIKSQPVIEDFVRDDNSDL
jgi:hypothetical protein